MSKFYCARSHEFWKNILPTNFTNLHEFFALQFNGDLVGRTNFHESNDGGSGMSFLTTTGTTLDNKRRGQCAWQALQSIAICLEGSTERSDGNRGRSPRIGKRGRCACKALRHRTCLNQPLIALVQIRATDPVAILSLVTIRVHSCNSWAKINSLPIALAKDNFKLSQVVPVVVIYPSLH